MAVKAIIHRTSTRSPKLGDRAIHLTALAESTGISLSHLSRIFSGAADPSIQNLFRISMGVGMTPGEFLDALMEHRSTRPWIAA